MGNDGVARSEVKNITFFPISWKIYRNTEKILMWAITGDI